MTPPTANDLAAIEGFVEAFNAGDVDALLHRADPGIVMATAREWPGGGVYRGADEVRRFIQEFRGDWAEIRFERLTSETVGDRLVERSRWLGRGRTTGIETQVDFYAAWTVRDGRVRRVDVFARRDEAREFARSDASDG